MPPFYLLYCNQGEAITFRATTAGVLTTLQHCLEVINHRDESWRRKLEREVERRKRVEELCTQMKDRMSKMRMASWPGPDFEVSCIFNLSVTHWRLNFG